MTVHKAAERKPLHALISRRGFDRFQPGSRSRWAAHRLSYKVTYHNLDSESAFLQMEYAGAEYGGEVTAWENGAIHLKAWEFATGDVEYEERWQVQDEDAFHWYMILPLCVHYLNFGTHDQVLAHLRHYKEYIPEQSARFGISQPDVVQPWAEFEPASPDVGQPSHDVGE